MKKQKYLPIVVVVIFGAIGVYLLAASRAATPTASVESENSTLTNPATKITDTTASGGQALKFGTAASTGFVHPGVTLDRTQLDFVKDKLTANAAPWTAGYNKFYSWTKAIPYPTYPTADLTLDCNANMDACTKVVQDAFSAYTQALMYYYKGDRAAAQSSAKIMNKWATHLKGQTGSQAKLNLAWAGETIIRAAEILRYTYTPTGTETVFNVPAFTTMLTNVYQPALVANTPETGSSNGNWDLSFIDTTMNIAVFKDDRALFDSAVSRWRARVPSYIYMTSDGSIPVTPPGGYYNTAAKVKCFWLASNSATESCTVPAGFAYTNGMSQETCRDISHVASGMSSMIYAAETARIQGVDLYGEQKTRITTGFEYMAKYYNAFLTTGTWPNSPCGKAPTGGEGGTNGRQGWEVGYNAYAGRLGVPMPETQSLISKLRPTGASNQFAWETLTHAKN